MWSPGSPGRGSGLEGLARLPLECIKVALLHRWLTTYTLLLLGCIVWIWVPSSLGAEQSLAVGSLLVRIPSEGLPACEGASGLVVPPGRLARPFRRPRHWLSAAPLAPSGAEGTGPRETGAGGC